MTKRVSWRAEWGRPVQDEEPPVQGMRTDSLGPDWLDDWLPNVAPKLVGLARAFENVVDCHCGMEDGTVEDQGDAEDDLEGHMAAAKDAVIEAVHALVTEFVDEVIVGTGTEDTLLIPFLDDLRDSLAEQSVTLVQGLIQEDRCKHCGAIICCGTAAEDLESWESLA